MDTFYRPTRVEISLDALRHNLTQFRNALPPETRIMAVVKANAYGHGAVQIAEEAIDWGADYLSVAFLDEALELRLQGIQAPILVMGYTPPEGLAAAAKHNITLNVYTRNVLSALQQLTNLPKLKIHIKLDTGMGRIGLHDQQEAINFINEALRLQETVEVEGLFTHFANADEIEKAYSYQQYERFKAIVDHFHEQGVAFPILHTGNSAAAIDLPELTYNMVRIGISMYGLYPSEDVNKTQIQLQPVLSLKTSIVNVKTLPPGSGISYGTIYHTTAEEQIATLPIGYADGFSRMLTGKAHALVHGQKVPVVGRICMDQCMINVTGIDNIQIGDEVTLIGTQGNESIPAEEIASQLGTINYEVTCMVAHRVPRIFMRQNETIQVSNPLGQLDFS